MRTIYSALLCGALLIPHAARAQDAAPPAPATPAPATPAAAKTKAKGEVINVGELRLDGKITAILGEGIWQMEATSWTSPRGVSTDFEEPKSKGVTVAATASIHPRGETERVPLRDVKLSTRVAIIGKNGPDGSLIAREVILLEGYGSRRTVGSVPVSAFTLALVKQSRAAREAGQLPKALQLIDRAISTAKGQGDLSGEGLATQDKALIHSDLEQPKEALAAFTRVQTIGRTGGNMLLLSLGLNGGGSMLRAAGQTEKALAMYKEADTASVNQEPGLRMGILSNLATTYLIAGQLQNGIAALNRLHPLEDAAGKESDAGETLLLVAALTASERSAAARQTLLDVQGRIGRARDEKARAGLIGTAGLVRWRLGERDAARAGFVQAAQALQTAGATADAKRWEGMAARLEAADENWQQFFLAATGLKTSAKPATEGAEGGAPAGGDGGGGDGGGDGAPPADNAPA